MYHKIKNTVFFLVCFTVSLNGQELFFPNMANSITPSYKKALLIGGTITTTDYGQFIDIAIGYSPAKNFGIMFYERGKKGNIAVGGGVGWYKTINFTEKKIISRKLDVYAGFTFDKLIHPSYDLKYVSYFIQGGVTEQYKKWGFSINSRLNIIDFTTIAVKREDEMLKEIMEEIDQDPFLFTDISVKLFYGNEIKGFIKINQPFYKGSLLINNDRNFALGAEVNIGYVYRESTNYFKRKKP
jgi:hypothetical protein